MIFSTELLFTIYIIFDPLLNTNIFCIFPFIIFFNMLVIYLIINREFSHDPKKNSNCKPNRIFYFPTKKKNLTRPFDLVSLSCSGDLIT